MTIDEAIEYNEKLYEGLSEEMVSTYGAALKLSIEALRRLEEWRRGEVLSPSFMLPGETE